MALTSAHAPGLWSSSREPNNEPTGGGKVGQATVAPIPPSRQKTIEKTCQACGGSFLVSPKKANQKTCSRVCGSALYFGRDGGQLVDVKCAVCEGLFRKSIFAKKKYCSRDCSSIARRIRTSSSQRFRDSKKRTCVVCGTEFLPSNLWRTREQRTCGKRCSYIAQTVLAGETVSNKNGYVRVKQEDGSWRHLHILVAERSIGRRLSQNEVVHHRDGDKENNSPDNLEVMTRREHAIVHQIAERIGLSVVAQKAGLPFIQGNWIHPVEGCEV